MAIGLTRRTIVATCLRLPLLAAIVDGSTLAPAEAGDLPRFGPPQPFDFERVKEMARARAATPYVDHPPRYSSRLEAIDYDAAGKIRYRDEAALWPRRSGSFPIKLFHLHRYAKD